ncbi:sensor domain-containing diguanylate cyclase [Deinococcus roseus]|uniref:GGDEF domain-containing protein n=1 Tax=Deinococcus roseus TaxID=392414 RepID=A0ABQ2CW48_9DEIO|nr:sensor domain-containing diguanylate cyclase [Deinococcus roseus]GGJ26641.1 hypothetical protein GCM10008938_10980 [Deinococcus roseus]
MTDQRIARYQAIFEILELISHDKTTSEIIKSTYQLAHRVAQVPIMLIALVNQKYPNLLGIEVLEEGIHTQLTSPRRDDGLIECVLRGETILTGDFQSYLRTRNFVVRSTFTEVSTLTTRSWLGVPFKTQKGTVGALSWQSYEADFFDEEDLHFAELLAKHLGFAISNAELWHDLNELAHTDVLTDLGNRRAFMLSIDERILSQSPFALVVMDIQKFKQINDNYGHQTGDEVLAAVGEALRQHTRGMGKVYRLGGDEFALLTLADVAVVERVVAKVQDALRHRFPDFSVQLNSGVALFPQDARTEDALYHVADQAMYLAKSKSAGMAVKNELGSEAAGPAEPQ